ISMPSTVSLRPTAPFITGAGMTQFSRLVLSAAAALALAGQAGAETTADPSAAAASAPAQRSTLRYTFSWPLHAQAPAPRGGTTRGPEEALDLEPSADWLELQAPGLSAKERDRRAILAMAGA